MREASPPTPPANKFAAGEALSFSRLDLWDSSGPGVGDRVVQGSVCDLVQGGVVDLVVVAGDKVLLLSIAELLFEVSGGLVSACVIFVTFEVLAIATFISRTYGWIESEQWL